MVFLWPLRKQKNGRVFWFHVGLPLSETHGWTKGDLLWVLSPVKAAQHVNLFPFSQKEATISPFTPPSISSLPFWSGMLEGIRNITNQGHVSSCGGVLCSLPQLLDNDYVVWQDHIEPEAQTLFGQPTWLICRVDSLFWFSSSRRDEVCRTASRSRSWLAA